MSHQSVLGQFDRLNVWGRGGQRAPHKPLLVLYALGRWARGERDDIPFREVDRDLTPLLKEFGPPRQSHHPGTPSTLVRRASRRNRLPLSHRPCPGRPRVSR
jgi:putative restriction endonuclease